MNTCSPVTLHLKGCNENYKQKLYKHGLKVETFDNYLRDYPIFMQKIIECSIEANKFVNPEFFADCVKFEIRTGLHDDFAKDKFTFIIYSYHLNDPISALYL